MHLCGSVGQVRKMQRVMDWPRLGDFLAGQRQPRGTAPGVYLQHYRLEDACLRQSIFEPNGEGHQTMDDSPLACQELPRPFLGAGHQRPLVPINHEHRHS
jgi:hypothetical protein